jgi:hypothetical protein
MCTKRSQLDNAAFSLAVAAMLLLASSAGAQVQLRPGINVMPMGGANPPAGPVNLPFMTNDGSGGMWYVYNDGSIRQQMGPAIYAQGALLSIEGNNFAAQNNQGQIARTGELILRNPDVNDLAVTRRIFFDKENAYVRYIDVLRNGSGQDQTVNVVVQSTLNWGVTQAQLLDDPKHKDQHLAWTGMTNFGRAVLEVYGGSGGKVLPTINYPNNSNIVQASFAVTIPAGKEAAIMHLHLFVPTLEAGARFVTDLKAAKLIHSLPLDVRRAVVNFSTDQDWLSDISILRGDVFDIVELRGGDELKGTLNETDYKLDTFYGPVSLSPQRVVAMLNIGQSRPRQLLVTDDGEIFAGRLNQPTIGMTLTSGQKVDIPLEQINRLGYRKRPNEPEEWTFDKPLVLMRGGDRVTVQPPAGKIDVATRYGMLSLDPPDVTAILFQPEDGGIHQILLSDGSKLAGLVSGDALEMKLSGAGPDQSVQFPVGDMVRLQLSAKTPDTDPDAPSLTLTNQDLLCGSLDGTLSLRTAFDAITLDGAQIRHIGHNGGELQVTLWDGSIISGRIEQPTVGCRLLCGVELNVPLPLLNEYNQPHPLPSADMIKQIEAAAADLNADDWRQRDRAEATLKTMGPAVIGVLRQVRDKQPPEAQQRIDAIIKALQPASPKPTPTPNPDDVNKQ